MTPEERKQKLFEFRKKCTVALDDPKTKPDDFFSAMMGWALFTDALEKMGVPRKELYEGNHRRYQRRGSV